jgi:hypothetical protein
VGTFTTPFFLLIVTTRVGIIVPMVFFFFYFLTLLYNSENKCLFSRLSNNFTNWFGDKRWPFGKISGQWGVETFHAMIILHFWFKVDVAIGHVLDAPLMHPNEGDETTMGDVVGTLKLWNWNYVKIAN